MTTLIDQARALSLPQPEWPADMEDYRIRLETVTKLCWEMADELEKLNHAVREEINQINSRLDRAEAANSCIEKLLRSSAESARGGEVGE